ncbi:aldose epimerase family protein [Paracoccus sp. R86501]|uniref:aldose epimerase family protein n=1 Tax=Paracoccus sp. R86501 TaxID=3101711 RepID=UPI00366F5C50
MSDHQLPDGRTVRTITLRNGPMRARVLTLGAIVQDLRHDDVPHPLVLGCADIAEYLDAGLYVGALVGRCANRIAQGRATVDGTTHQLDRNFRGRHCLHGGRDGTAVQIWQVEQVQADSVHLSLTLPDGHMGFPGAITIQAAISLQPDALQIAIQATSDAPTPCNIVHHGYFNLDDAPTVDGHRLQVAADSYLPVDDDLIPLGDPQPVAGTPFDFRHGRRMAGVAVDHNFCLQPSKGLHQVANLRGENGLALQVHSDAPGLQVYDGAHFTGLTGLEGRTYGPRAGLALETQAWPDAMGRAGYPNVILRPGQTYCHNTVYRFARDQ